MDGRAGLGKRRPERSPAVRQRARRGQRRPPIEIVTASTAIPAAVDDRRRKRYIITNFLFWRRQRSLADFEITALIQQLMAHHHHHHPGHAHPPARVAASILRLSAVERLAAIAIVAALMWAAVFWAMT